MSFGVDNNSLPHNDNRKNIFLVLSEGLTYGIGSFGLPEKQFGINFSKARTKLFFSLHNNGNSYFFPNGTEIFMFNANKKKCQLSNSILFKKHM